MSWDPIANVSPYPRIDLYGPKPITAAVPQQCVVCGSCGMEAYCSRQICPGKQIETGIPVSEQDRIWRAVVATAEGSNVEGGQ